MYLELYDSLEGGKKKTVPLQAQRGPEGSRKLRFPDFLTTEKKECFGKICVLRQRIHNYAIVCTSWSVSLRCFSVC